ncbi:hypothetical protein DNTS_015094, partial [Danionella cerebrum]
MAVPFSNTNLRIPRGFGNLLEGLAREVLRDQPEDIPTFAALYFTKLLKSREESCLDPAEWGAKLEDRFYNNGSFMDGQQQGNISPAKINPSHNTSLSESFGNSGTQFSIVKDPTTNSEDNHVKINEICFENYDVREQRLAEGTADTHISLQELKDHTWIPEEQDSVVDQDVDVDIFESEPSNVDVFAEEMKPPFETAESKRDPESPTLSDDEEDFNNETNEMPYYYINAEDADSGSAEEASVEEPGEKDLIESVGIESDNENQEESKDENKKLYEFLEDSTDSTSEINSSSLIEIKDTNVDFSDDNKSKVIDEVRDRSLIYTSDNESSSNAENTSKIIGELKEENVLETPASQHYDSEIDLSHEFLNASEKDLNTENINEGSDFDSDAEDMDPDILSELQPNTIRTESQKEDRILDVEDNFESESEETSLGEHLERETGMAGEALQELIESSENEGNREDQLMELKDELTLESEELDITDCTEAK